VRTRLFVLLQHVLPRHLLTSLVYHIARTRAPFVKNLLIACFVRLFRIDTGEAALDVPGGFATLNDFFIRELKAAARLVDPDPGAICSPVDGFVSLVGQLAGNNILQAKGLDYTLDELLASDLDDARAFVDGAFATLYLAPHNYHRVHAPLAGDLVAARYVPGDLFSVNHGSVTHLSGLFLRNERLIMRFQTDRGPMAVIFVGALNVGSISTPWSGEIRPRKTGLVEAIKLDPASTHVQKGDLLGWFNMGSTVIVLLPTGSCEWHDELEPGVSVTMGKAIGRLVAFEPE